MIDIIVEIIAAAGLVLVAILQLRSEKERKKRTKADAHAEQRRKDELAMSIKQGNMMLASGELAYVTSLAVTGGHTNGNVEEAQTQFVAAKREYKKFQNELASKYLQEG